MYLEIDLTNQPSAESFDSAAEADVCLHCHQHSCWGECMDPHFLTQHTPTGELLRLV